MSNHTIINEIHSEIARLELKLAGLSSLLTAR